MDWDDITSAKGAGAKPGRVTLGAWLGLAVLVALHATLFVVGTLCMTLAHGFARLLIGRIIMGLGVGTGIGPWAASRERNSK